MRKMSETVARPLRRPGRLATTSETGTATVAVVGTGTIGMRHLEALRELQGVQPVAVPRRAGRIGELAARGFQSAPDVSAAVGLGARFCIIATDTSRHVEDGLLALAGGCTVLVEKPLACTAAEARRLADAAKGLHRRLFVGCVLRFSESLNAFRQRLPEIGEVHAVRIESQSYLPEWRPERPYRESYSARADEGGVLRDLIHEIDYAGWLFGWPNAVAARMRNGGRLGIDAEEAAELWWDAPQGGAVSVRLDYLTRPARRRMSAYGEFGTLTWDGIIGGVTLELVNAPPQVSRTPQTREALFLAQAHAFTAAGAGSIDARLATAEDGVRALAVCDAARRASESRSNMTVELA